MNKDSMRSLQVICPVFNEESVLEDFYAALSSELEAIEDRYIWSVLFVMDRSSDRSADILRALAAKDSRVRVLMLSSRFGHQMSLVAGIDHSDADAVLMMDSDLQHPPSLIPSMLDAFEQGNEVVVMVRREPADDSYFKRQASRSFYRVMSRLSDVPLAAGAADFRLISRRVATVFRTQIRERNQFLRGLFSWVGFQRIDIEYNPHSRSAGESKYNWGRMFRFAAAGIVSFSKKPLQYAISLGVLFAALGLIFTFYVLIGYFIHDEVPSGWSTLAILISVFGGLQLIFLGVLGEYIGAIFDEVKGRPMYLVEEQINVE